jgi:hypothetical protein
LFSCLAASLHALYWLRLVKIGMDDAGSDDDDEDMARFRLRLKMRWRIKDVIVTESAQN